jgi:hypothetical protein
MEFPAGPMGAAERRPDSDSQTGRKRVEMGEIGESRYYDKRELTRMLQVAELRIQALELALRQIAEQPSDDPAALQQLAQHGLQKASEVSSDAPVAAS